MLYMPSSMPNPLCSLLVKGSCTLLQSFAVILSIWSGILGSYNPMYLMHSFLPPNLYAIEQSLLFANHMAHVHYAM